MQAAELSIRYPKSGGVYTFPSRAISKDAGFLTARGYLVSNVIAVAFAHPNFNPANFRNFFGQGVKGGTGWIEAVPNAMKAMADDDRFPAVCKRLNKSHSPSTAIWITTVAACLLSCLPRYTELLVNLGSLVAAVNIAMVIPAAVFARKKTTLEEGAFRAPGGNAVSILTVVLILCTYIPKFTSGDLQMWLFTAIIYSLSLLAMVYYRRRAK